MRSFVVRVSVVGAILALATFISPPVHAVQMEAGKAATKLGRGAVNTVTGWVEIPKCINETAQESGALAGATWGLLRGLGHGFIRTVAGVYELVTFPFPAPPDYEPVMEPEYVFSDQSAKRYSK